MWRYDQKNDRSIILPSQCKVARLPKVGFVPEDDPNAVGFLDSALILHGCHLGPAFANGCTSELLETVSLMAARPLGESDDWANFYITIWVDRDSISAPQKKQSSAEVPSQQPDATTAEIPGERTRGHPDGEGDDDEGGSDSEEDSDVEPQDLDSDNSNEGEGSDAAYDDHTEQDGNGFASV
ncbi:hypothetical protein DFH08DRAFT_811334 [Mycena albidolilacea]|uniref:Uncharacterized protein n=1 Tax=Mycena albidolilacea TaxID=1033008 RepID=A0AAD7EPR8_9AGAR|nr:hypothetical protein DFH08DRAFT_811334 [Mycena albidolilacea]